MLEQVARILKQVYAQQILLGQNMTVGEIAKELKMSYSTVKRRLLLAEKSNLVVSEILPYKATGKRVFWLSEDGLNWVSCYREMSL